MQTFPAFAPTMARPAPVPFPAPPAATFPAAQPRPQPVVSAPPSPPQQWAPSAPAQVHQQPEPTFRGAQPDAPPVQPRPVLLSLPSPEQLGVPGSSDDQAPDWNAVRQRLHRLGAVGFHLSRVDAGYRVSVLLPTGESDQARHVEATVATEAEAVRLALDRAEQVAGGRH